MYKTHDQAYMIAVCPSCHDAIHNGKVPFSDELLLGWKKIRRPELTEHTHIYVEPGGTPAFQLGSVYMRSSQGGGMTFLRAANGTRLGLRVPDQEIAEVDLVVCDAKGSKLIETRAGNHVRLGNDDVVEIRTAPGAVQVWAPSNRRFVPEWLMPMLEHHDAHLLEHGRVLLASARVVSPSVVKIEGIWTCDEHRAVVLDVEWMSFYDRFVAGPPTRVRGQPGKDILMTFDERVESVFASFPFKLSMAQIFGKRNFLRAEAPCTIVFKDGTRAAIPRYGAVLNEVQVYGPRDSTADYFKRFLLEVTWAAGSARCGFQDGSATNLRLQL